MLIFSHLATTLEIISKEIDHLTCNAISRINQNEVLNGFIHVTTCQMV